MPSAFYPACGDGYAAVQIETMYDRRGQLSLVSCRPIPGSNPDGTAEDWCNSAPPDAARCACDNAGERLQFKRDGACWICTGTGQRC
jgi:hypothetical protein